MKLSDVLKKVKDEKPDHIWLMSDAFFYDATFIDFDEKGNPVNPCAACILTAAGFCVIDWKWWRICDTSILDSEDHYKSIFPILDARLNEFNGSLRASGKISIDRGIESGRLDSNPDLFDIVIMIWDDVNGSMNVDRVIRIVQAAEEAVPHLAEIDT